jgi:hypothetical protein
MDFKTYLIIMAFVSAAAWIGWLVVINSIDPVATGMIGLFLFYTTLGISVLSSSTFFGTGIRVWFHPNQLVHKQSSTALRQGILLTGVFLLTLMLSGRGLLVWWVFTLIVIIAAFLELIFMSDNHRA